MQMRKVSLAGLAALLLWAPSQAQEQAQAQAAVVAAPELALRTMGGAEDSLAAHRGKIVILNFWATWCVPCREEMPMLEKLRREYSARGVEVIGASTDLPETQKQIAPFVKKLKLTFPIWLGATLQDMERFGLGTALPATAVIDREGRIVGRILGPLEEPDLRTRVEWLLGNRTGEEPAATLDTFAKHKAAEGEHEGHEHKPGEEEHSHGVGLDGASTVPS